LQRLSRPPSSRSLPPAKQGLRRHRGHVTRSLRILISDELDLQESSDNSFLLHELVHVLQFRYQSGSTFASCEDTLKSEREAYRAQNAYLRRQGRLERYGDMLMHVSCAPVQPRGGTSVTLEMSPGGPNEAQAFDRFMEEWGRDRTARKGLGK